MSIIFEFNQSVILGVFITRLTNYKTMHLTFSASHADIDHAIQGYIQGKIPSLGKYIDLDASDVRIAVQLGKTHGSDRNADDLYQAEIRIAAGGKDYYVTGEHGDIHAAFDLARDEMAKVLQRAKDKKISMTRRGRNLMRKMFGKSAKY